MENVGDDYYSAVLALPVPTNADRARNSRIQRRRRSSEETTRGRQSPNPPHFSRDILIINAGEDVAERILSHFNEIPPPSGGRLGIILSAIGSVLNPVISSRILTKSYEGSFTIATLTSHYVIPRVGMVRPDLGLKITFPGSNGELSGGFVEGPLIAATEIQLCLCSFPLEAE